MVVNVPQFIDINSKLCLTIGGFLNCLLIWLVIKKTPREMKSYSKIVLQTCVCDLANLIIGDIEQPVLFIFNGVAGVVSLGIAGQFPHPWNAFAYYVWIFCAFFAIIGIIVQFMYRYFVICKNVDMSNTHYFMMLGAVAVGLLGYFAWLLYLSFPANNSMVDDEFVAMLLGHNKTELERATEIGQHSPEKTPFEFRLALRGIGGTPFWIAWHVGFVTTVIVTYVCIAYFGREMIIYTKKNRKVRSDAVELNRQLTLNLILQAIIPLAAMLGWVLCAYACIFGAVSAGNFFNYFTSLFATPTQNWTSVLNPLVTILTIKSYRKAVIRIVFCGRAPIAITPTTFGGAGTGPAGSSRGRHPHSSAGPIKSITQADAAQKYVHA